MVVEDSLARDGPCRRRRSAKRRRGSCSIACGGSGTSASGPSRAPGRPATLAQALLTRFGAPGPARTHRAVARRRRRVGLPAGVRGARASPPFGTARRCRSCRASPTSRRWTTGPAAAPTFISSRSPRRSPRCAGSSAPDADGAHRDRLHRPGVLRAALARRGAARSRPAAGGDDRLVSGGGWGVGDVEGAIEVALAVPGTTVVCLAGRNDALRALLARPVRRRAACPDRGVHRGDVGLARRRRRPRALDRRADGLRGAAPRVPGRSRTAGDAATSGSTTRRSSASGWPRSRRRRRSCGPRSSAPSQAVAPKTSGFDDLPLGRIVRARSLPMRADRARTRGARRLVCARSGAGRARHREADRRSDNACRSGVESPSRSTTARTAKGRQQCSSSSRDAGARATFFLVGEQVERMPGAGSRRSPPPVTRSASTATGHVCCCGARLERCATTSRAPRT